MRPRSKMVLCAVFMAALAWLAFASTGLSVVTVFVAFLLLGCLFSMLWAWWIAHQSLRALDEQALYTDGVTMNWAAPFYDACCPWFGIGTELRRETLRHANIATGERVLDVGCGTGVLTRLAADAVGCSGCVIGIDPSPGMIAVARRNAASAGSPAGFRLAAIEELPYPDRSFDVVLSSFMLHHLPPEVKVTGLTEVRRVLKDGGRLLAVDIDRPANAIWWLVFWPLLFTVAAAPNLRGEIPSYLRKAGFAPVDVLARKWGLVTFWSVAKPTSAEGIRA